MGERAGHPPNGNTLTDNAHSYTWDAEGKAITLDSVGATYDALGRMVEQNRSGAYTQIVYSLTGGKLALMTGQTLSKAFVSLPGSAVAVYGAGGTLSYFRHPDWLGTARLSSDPSHNIVSDLAYAPFGETYAESGSPDRSFTGQNQDTIPGSTTGLYDFLYREYAQYGRWTSPDPAGASVAGLGDPQSWNRYAYVTNSPQMFTDPLGLDLDETSGVCSPAFGVCLDFGGGGDDGGGPAGAERPKLPKPDGPAPPICGRDPSTGEPIPCYYDDTRFLLCMLGVGPGCQLTSPNVPVDPREIFPKRPKPTSRVGPVPKPQLKPSCTDPAVSAAIDAAVQDAKKLPSGGPAGDFEDVIKNKDFQGAAVGTLYVIGGWPR